MKVPVPADQSVIYDGKPHTSAFSGNFTVEKGNVTRTNADTVDITLTRLSANYEWVDADGKVIAGNTVVVKFTVEKAKVSISDLTVGDFTFGVGEAAPEFTRSDVYDGNVVYSYTGTTNAGVAYSSSKAPKLAGSYKLTLTISDTANCEIIAGKGSVYDEFVIERAKLDKPEATVVEIPYDGENHKPTLTEDEEALAESNNGITDVGDYSITFALPNVYDYEWNVPGEELDVENVTVHYYTITQADNVWETTPDIDDDDGKWSYGEASAAIKSYESKFGDTVTVTLNGETLTDGKLPAKLDAGDYTLVFTVAGTENYKVLTETVTFEVETIKVTVPKDQSAPYDKTEHESSFGGEDYTVTNVKRTNAGTDEIPLTLRDSKNYEWVDADGKVIAGDTVKVKFTVNKAKITVDALTVDDFTFNVGAASPTFTVNALYDGDKNNAQYRYTGTTNGGVKYDSTEAPTLAGNYTLTVTLPDTDNCDGQSASDDFVILRRQIGMPNVSNTEVFYNGSEQRPVITQNANLYNIAGATDVGEYDLAVSIKDTDNYEWNEAAQASAKTVHFVINKLTTTLTISIADDKKNVTYTGFEYDGLNTSCNITDITGENVVVYYYRNSSETTWSTEVPKDVGLYYVYAEVVKTKNYTGKTTDTLEFTIDQAEPDVNFYDYNAGERYQNTVMQGGIAIGVDGEVVNGTFKWTPEGTNKFAPSESSAPQGVYYTLTFESSDANYDSVTAVVVVVYLKPAAYITTNGEKTYYGSIEDALGAAQDGDVVWAVVDDTDMVNGGNVIASDCTIKKGVTLVIPYAADVRLNGNHKASQAGTSAPSVTVTNTVTIAAGKTLTVIGNLEVSGQLYSGKGGALSAGHTHGKTAQIVLSKNAKIVGDKDETSAGVIELYGFIEELTKDNGSMVIIKSGAKIYMPLVIRDFRGGTLSSAVKENWFGQNLGSVFNQMAFVNITPSTEVQSGGSLYGMANMFASDDYHASDGFVIGGHNSTAVIKLDQGSIFKSKYDKETDILKIDIYGGASTNAMKITVGGTTVSTGDFAFAMSYHYDITLKALDGQNNVYNINQLFKLLPGAKLTVDPGVTLNITNMNIYAATFRDNCKTRPYPTANPVTDETFDDAKLIVYGTLTATNLGGNVYIMSGATFDASKSYSSTTKDIIDKSNFDTYEQEAVIIKDGVIVTLDAVGGSVNSAADTTNGIYNTLPTPTRYGYDFLGWYYGDILVTEGMALQAEGTHTLVAKWQKIVVIILEDMDTEESTDVFSVDGKYPTLPTPTKAGFKFEGWYFAGVKVNAGDELKSTENHILVAKWSTDIKISFVSEGAIVEKYVVSADGKYPTLPTPNRANYDFTGWYYGDTKVEAGMELVVGRSHYLTAAWEESQLESYTVTFNPNGGTCGTKNTSANEGSTITLPKVDARMGYTFAGWYTDESGGERVGGEGDTYTLGDNVTLYAQWTPIPYQVTVSTSNATVTITVNGSTVANGGSIPCGATVTITVEFNKWLSKKVVVTDENGNVLLSKTSKGTYTFTMPAGSVTISASSSSLF